MQDEFFRMLADDADGGDGGAGGGDGGGADAPGAAANPQAQLQLEISGWRPFADVHGGGGGGSMITVDAGVATTVRCAAGNAAAFLRDIAGAVRVLARRREGEGSVAGREGKNTFVSLKYANVTTRATT